MFFFLFFSAPRIFKNNCNLKIYIFCPLRAETFFKALITVAISRTYWNYFFSNILFVRRRRKNFEVLITAALLSGTSLKLFFKSTFFSARHRRKFWDPNNGPVSRISLKLFFSKYAFFSAAAGGKIFGARLIYVMKNLSKTNNFQTDFLKTKIKIKIWGVATPNFRLILIFSQSPETGGLPPGKIECKGLFKVHTTWKDNILDHNHYLFCSARSAEKNF